MQPIKNCYNCVVTRGRLFDYLLVNYSTKMQTIRYIITTAGKIVVHADWLIKEKNRIYYYFVDKKGSSMKETEGQKVWNEYWGTPKPKKHFNIKRYWFLVFLILVFFIKAGKTIADGGGILKSDTVDLATGQYLIALQDIEGEINQSLTNMVLEYNANGEVNLVEAQKYINKCIELFDNVKKKKVTSVYKIFKKNQEDAYNAILETLQNAVSNDNLNEKILQQILESYTKTVNKRENEMIEIFDKQGVEYTISEKTNGERIITYKYQIIK